MVTITHICVLIAHSKNCIAISETFAHYITKGSKKLMTIKQLKMIIEDLADDTVILIEGNDINEVETVNIQIYSDGHST